MNKRQKNSKFSFTCRNFSVFLVKSSLSDLITLSRFGEYVLYIQINVLQQNIFFYDFFNAYFAQYL